MEIKMKNNLHYALEYLKEGRSVIPLRPTGKNPYLDSWAELQERRPTEEEVNGWWTQWPDANIGIVTGDISGITVVDFDAGSNKDGFPPTLAVKTGGGGWHYYYSYNASVSNRVGILPKTDIRNDGGYVVAPPSIHPDTGKTYEWKEWSGPLESFPVDLFKQEHSNRGFVHISEIISSSEGVRNSSLHRAACSMLGREDAETAWLVVNGINSTFKPPLPLIEVKSVFDSARKFITQKGEMSEKENESQILVDCFSNISPESVKWLWPGRIALGKLTLIAGDPGLGKSLLTTTLAAIVSKGFPWPVDGSKAPVGDVLLLSAEDDPADTIRPRLDAADADCSRVHVLKAVRTVDSKGKSSQHLFSFRRDLALLEHQLMLLPDCKLLVIDPISAYLDGTDSNNNSDIRGLFAPLAEMAARHNIAVVSVSHLNKGVGGSAIYRTMGSLAFVAAARAAYVVTKDKDNPARRLVMPAKNNLAKSGTGLAYSVVESEENGAPVTAWELEPVDITADEALAQPENSEEQTNTDWAIDFLQDLLSRGPIQALDVHKNAKQASVTSKSLRRAQSKLGIKPQKDGFIGGWVWALPHSEDALSNEDAPHKSEGILGAKGHLGRASNDC
jgi:putative DNA primase/helicase